MNYESCKPTYMFRAKVSDFTSSIWVNFVREQGEIVMGMTAEEFKSFKDSHSHEEVTDFLDSLKFNTYNIMVRGKMEASYNGETRPSYFASKVFPQSLLSENKALLQRLETYSAL